VKTLALGGGYVLLFLISLDDLLFADVFYDGSIAMTNFNNNRFEDDAHG